MDEKTKKEMMVSQMEKMIEDLISKSNECFLNGDIKSAESYADYVYSLRNMIPQYA